MLIGGAALLAGSLLALAATPKDEVTAAAKKLADQPNYSWKQTVTVPEGSQFQPGPTTGKAQKDGLLWVSMTMRDNEMQMLRKGDKAAYIDQDGNWQAVAEGDSSEGPGRFMGMMARNLRPPAAQVEQVLTNTATLKKDGDTYAADLTEDGAKNLMMFGRRGRGGGGEGPSISNAKGSVKFWVKDGVLSKFEYKVQGTMTWNNNDRDIDRTTTVEIKDVGTTKIDVPEDAKKKVS